MRGRPCAWRALLLTVWARSRRGRESPIEALVRHRRRGCAGGTRGRRRRLRSDQSNPVWTAPPGSRCVCKGDPGTHDSLHRRAARCADDKVLCPQSGWRAAPQLLWHRDQYLRPSVKNTSGSVQYTSGSVVLARQGANLALLPLAPGVTTTWDSFAVVDFADGQIRCSASIKSAQPEWGG